MVPLRGRSPSKVMDFEKKLLLNILTRHSKKKNKHVSISKKKIMFHVFIYKFKNTSLVKIIADFDFSG